MAKLKLLIAFLLFTTLSFGQSKITHFKFKISDKSEIIKITEIVSIDNFKNDTVWAYANETKFQKFLTLGYKIELLPHPTYGKVINMATTIAQMSSWDKYPTYEVYIQMMNKFATDYPNLCQTVNIGTSVDGRQLIGIKISDNVTQHEAEPEYFYTSTMHGDETTGMILLLRLANWLLSNYGTNTEATNIVNNFELYINPNANPDGTYSGGNNTVSNSQRYNSNGEDINRDFPYPLSSNSPYQPETQAMMNFATSHNFVMSANFHGGTEVMNYPWDCWTSAENIHSDDAWFFNVCTDYVQTARTVFPSYMTDLYSSGVTEGADWYYAMGSRQDYMNYFAHCKEITIEISTTKLLSSDLLPAYWNYNFQSLLDFIKEANYGFNGTVKDALTNAPLDAKIEITSHDADNSWVVTDPENGDYYRPIAPGTYSVTYSAFGYTSKTESVTVSGWKTTTIKNVVLNSLPSTILTGVVTDASSGQVLNGVEIEILNSPIGTILSNSNGTFSIPSVYYNTYQIKASKTGYYAQTKTFTVDGTNNNINFALSVSNPISFETEIPVNWTFGGNANWTRISTGAYAGTYCMKSGTIGSNATSTLLVTKDCMAGEISFYKKVSSELNYDFLKFYIDDVIQDSWSGNVAWSEQTYDVTDGNHTFKWEYSKDQSTISGSDCAWIDYVNLPPDLPAPTYRVTFNISANSVAIQNVSVSLTGYGTQSTNESGVAIFQNINSFASPGIQYTISMAGYNSFQGNVIVDSDEIVDISLTPATTSFNVTFVVKNQLNDVIENAVVELLGYGTINTDSEGKSIFTNVSLTPTPGLQYNVNFTNYFSLQGNVIIDGNETIDVQIQPIPSKIEEIAINLKIYPNPSSGKFTIENDFEEILGYQIINQLGQVIQINNKSNSKTIEIDLSDYAKGLYFVKLNIGKDIVCKTISVQ